jgi:hypothetical protein
MTESRYIYSSSQRSPQFESPTASKNMKFTTSELRTNYKEGASDETTPYK